MGGNIKAKTRWNHCDSKQGIWDRIDHPTSDYFRMLVIQLSGFRSGKLS